MFVDIYYKGMHQEHAQFATTLNNCYKDLEEKLYILYEITPSSRNWAQELMQTGVTQFDYYQQPCAIWQKDIDEFIIVDLPFYTIIGNNDIYHVRQSFDEAVACYGVMAKQYGVARLLDPNDKIIAQCGME